MIPNPSHPMVDRLKAALRPVKNALVTAAVPARRREYLASRSSYLQFARESEALWRSVLEWPRPTRRVLLVTGGFPEITRIEVSLLASLRAQGYAPVVLMARGVAWSQKRFQLWGVEDFVFWEDFLPTDAGPEAVSGLQSFQDVLSFEVDGMRVGRWVASWTMRIARLGTFEPDDAQAWGLLMRKLPEGIRYARAAQAIIRATRPELTIFIERAYSPWGQLFDYCLREGVDVIQWVAAHKNNAIMMKRYHPGNEAHHPATLSADSWEYVKKMKWSADHTQRVIDELHTNYRTGEWANSVGTQFNKRILTREGLQSALGLDPAKKTAVLFPHLFWDATFFYGRDLFGDYERWFVETVRAAIGNPAVNWVIKLHPANVVKRNRDGYQGEYSELTAIRQHIGELPPHITLVPAESDISTYSFFSLMDYCLTVRGTIGLESGVFGIPVITAGTGRYDRLGFTLDMDSPEEYLNTLAGIQDIPRLTTHQQELAQRYAYAILLMRPCFLKSVSLEYQQDKKASDRTAFRVNSVREMIEAEDMRQFAGWAGGSTAEDWITLE